MSKESIGSAESNRDPVIGHFDAAGKFTPNEVQQLIEFIEIGAKVLQSKERLAGSQIIGATGLALIEKLEALPSEQQS